MDGKNLRKEWLPFLVALTGIVLSAIFAHFLGYHIEAYLDLLDAIKHHLPWLSFVIGALISLLLAIITKTALLAKARTCSLDETNESLRKEISERAEVEESKQKLEVALRQGQKLQAIGTLAGGIAHDFNNILYAIIGYIEMARDDVDKESTVYKNLGKVLEATARGQELVSRILAFSRRQHHQHDVVNLRKTIEAALSLLRPTIPASVTIKFEPEIDPWILANQTQLHQIFVNIINNAVDAMDDEGQITIYLSRIPANDPLLKAFSANEAQPYCRIDIVDTGHGMDQPTMERIFEPFFTTKEVGKGTGLGLSIVHTIIKEHRGEISVESLLGRGAKFTILLPEQDHSEQQGEHHGQNTTG